MALEIRLLGSIEARSNGQELPLGGSRQHRLLAFLALQPGRTRSFDSLLGAVWPDGNLPADPRQTMRTYVWRLRSALGDIGWITTRDGGYGLAVDEEAVDAKRFEGLLRAAADPSRPASAVLELLDEALALWVGPPLDGYESEAWAQPDAVRLEELHAQAVDDRAQVQIDLGLHAEAVAGLRAGAAANPLRERTQRLLMVALQRSGRQAEALRAYQDHRELLGSELGLEPSKEIRELEVAIASGSIPASTASPQRALRGYRLLDQVGAGAFAVVYRATQPSVHRDVAVKVIRPELADHPEFVRRFEAEAQLVASLEHPHIVPLYDYWREPGAAYLVMRLFQGGSLEQRLGRGPCTTAEVVALATQVGAALAAAHRAGVVHRDLKPANVFLDGDDNYFLGDFGIAADVGAPVEPIGRWPAATTANYASPERLRGDEVGPATDVYGFAVVLEEALTGVNPVAGAPTAALAPGVAAVVARATAIEPAERYPSVEELVSAWVAALADGSVTGAVESVALRNPYKGLRAFHESDALDFFGRKRMVARVVHELRGVQPASRFVVIVGPSGSGKSSLVRAGVVPALRAGAVPGSERWLITSMLPGAHPFEELDVALGRIGTRSSRRHGSLDGPDGRGIAHAVKELAPADEGDIVVVVDQFEELYTLCPDDVRQRFVAGLVAAVSDPHSRLRVIATVRADFYDRPLRDDQLAPLLEAGTVPVTPLAADELAEAITEPADRVGARLEPGLAALVVADLRDQPGALPLLQYALTEVFERNEHGLLTLAAYQEIHGMAGAVARRAEELFDEGDESERAVTRRVFTRLVSLGEGTEDTRRRVQVRELGDAPATEVVLHRYGAARLLSFDRDPQTREPTVECAHEALIRQWPRLRGWLDEDRDGLRLHRDLTSRAATWEAADRDVGELYRGARLESAEHWAAAHGGDLNPIEAAFLAASTDQRRRDAEAERRNVRRIKRGFVLVAIVAVLALLAGVVAWRQQQRASSAASDADRERDLARVAEFRSETGRLAALAPTLSKTNPVVAMLLAAEVEHRAATPETWGALQQALVAADTTMGFLFTDEPLRDVYFDGPDRIIGISTTTVTTWDAATHQVLRTTPLPVALAEAELFEASLHPLSFARGRVAWVGNDSALHVLDLGSGAHGRVGVDGVDQVVLDRAGARVAAVTRSGDVALYRWPGLERVWNVPGTGELSGKSAMERAGLTGVNADFDRYPVISDVQFADDDTVVLARAWAVTTLDAATGVQLGEATFPFWVNLFTPDAAKPGRVLALGYHAIASAELPSLDHVTAVGLGDQISGVEPDLVSLRDGRMVTVTAQGQVLVVGAGSLVEPAPPPALVMATPATSPVVETLDAHLSAAVAAKVSPDGTTLVVAGDAGAVLVRLDGGGLIRRAVPRTADHLYYIGGHEADWIASGSPDSDVPPEQLPGVRTAGRVWRCVEDPCTELDLGLDPMMEITAEPDRDLLAIFTTLSADDGDWQFLDGATMQPVGPRINLGTRINGWAAIAPDRSWVAIGNTTTGLDVFELATGRLLARYPYDDLGVEGPGISPTRNGDEVLVSDSATGASFLMDMLTGARRASPIPDGEAAIAVFGRTGKVVATAGLSGDVALRDGTTFEVLHRLATAEPISSFLSMAFSDDDRFVLTVHPTGGRLWDVATGELIGQLVPTLATTAPSSLPGARPHLLTASQEWVQVWDFDVDRWADLACVAAGRNLTRQEWAQVGPRDQEYRATCPQWPAAVA